MGADAPDVDFGGFETQLAGGRAANAANGPSGGPLGPGVQSGPGAGFSAAPAARGGGVQGPIGAGLSAPSFSKASRRRELETSLILDTGRADPLKIGEKRPTITHESSTPFNPDAPVAAVPRVTPSFDSQPDSLFEPPSQAAPAPAPAADPVPEIVAKPQRSAPLNQAGRRRNRFFARRGRSSIQVNQPAGSGLSIRRSGISGSF